MMTQEEKNQHDALVAENKAMREALELIRAEHNLHLHTLAPLSHNKIQAALSGGKGG